MPTKSHDYVPCTLDEIPEGVRFDVPGRNQGQIVEVAYGGFSRGEHGAGDPYKRVVDRSEGPTPRYYMIRHGWPRRAAEVL